jgi:subtilisin family serine protease
VDVSNMTAPREVAYYTVAGAGTHNFSVDEPNGILYAAYYNGGVRALDVRGDLGTCTVAQRSMPAGSTVPLCDLRLMGRELGIGLVDRGNSIYIWGVQYLGGAVYASDMVNGIWKLRSLTRP